MRHGLLELNIKYDDAGYADLKNVLKTKVMKGTSINNVKQVVEENDKERFNIYFKNGSYYIRANQGHSDEVAKKLDPEKIYKKVADPDEFNMCVHGTTREAILIIKNEGLKPMSRSHIHFAIGLPKDNVKSGIRGSSNVYVFIDLKKAINDGIDFYVSKNNVLLSKGKNGILAPEYFTEIRYVK